jgi:MIP family channel proteins
LASSSRIFVAELVGIFFLTFIGAGAILQSTAMGAAGYGLLGIALAHGVALSVAVSATGAVSGGHLNPAVTIGLASTGVVPWGRVPVYIAAQILGSALAAFLLTLVFPSHIVASAGLGTPAPAPGISFGTVVLLEAIMTFLLVFAVWGTAVDPRAPKIGGFGIGLTVFFDILVGGPITGAAMNPARVLGPALVGNVWSMHAAYWVGPVLGSVAGALVYKTFLHSKP